MMHMTFAGRGRHSRRGARRVSRSTRSIPIDALPLPARAPLHGAGPAVGIARLALCAAAIGIGAPAAAQSNAEVAGYLALSYTPVGALAPLPPSLGTGTTSTGSRYVLQGRWGRLSPATGLSNNTIGAGVEFPAGRWRVGGTLAYLSVSCTEDWEDFSDCDSDIMLGGSARTTLLTRPLDGRAPAVKRNGRRAAGAPSEKTFVLGFDGSLGFSPRQGEQATALAVGIPAGIAFESGNVRILPFLSPAFGYGRLGSTSFEEDEPSTTYSSTMMMIGGGVDFQFRQSGLGATIGFQKIMKTGGGGTALGLTMSWNGSSRSR